jgi:TPR repeat protein
MGLRFGLVALLGLLPLWAHALADWPNPSVPAVLQSEVRGIEFMRELNAPEAIKELEQAVQDGSTTALYRLAQIYFEGMGEQWAVRERAIEYLRQAVAKNQVESMFVLALVGSEGEQRALTLLERAAGLGMEAHVFKIGLQSMETRQPFSLATGIKLMEAAARAGFDPAMAVLGRFYIEGNEFHGVKADVKQAEMWLNRAIRAGYVSSIADLLRIIMPRAETYPEDRYRWLYLCHALKCSYLTDNPDVGGRVLPLLVELEAQMTPDMLAQTRVEINSLFKRIQRANKTE